MEPFTGSELKTLFLLLVVTEELTSVVLLLILALVTVQPWFQERDFPTRIWSLYSSTLQVSTEQDVSSQKDAEAKEDIWLTLKEKDLWRDTHQQPRIWLQETSSQDR